MSVARRHGGDHRAVQGGRAAHRALVRLYDTVGANADWLPPGLGVSQPIIKPKGIDDVPVVASHCTRRAPTAGRSSWSAWRTAWRPSSSACPARARSDLGGPGRAVEVEVDPAGWPPPA
jgi:hypothetical protein